MNQSFTNLQWILLHGVALMIFRASEQKRTCLRPLGLATDEASTRALDSAYAPKEALQFISHDKKILPLH